MLQVVRVDTQEGLDEDGGELALLPEDEEQEVVDGLGGQGVSQVEAKVVVVLEEQGAQVASGGVADEDLERVQDVLRHQLVVAHCLFLRRHTLEVLQDGHQFLDPQTQRVLVTDFDPVDVQRQMLVQEAPLLEHLPIQYRIWDCWL